MGRAPRRGEWRSLLIHLRLHYQLLFLSPLFVWGFMLGGGEPSLRAALGFVAFHVCLYGGLTAYNSYYDRDEGPVGGLRKPPAVVEALLPFSWAVQLVGLALALAVGTWFTIFYAIVMVLSVAYSHPRFRWKARALLSLGVVAIGQGALGFLGGWVCGHEPVLSLVGVEPLLGVLVASLSAVGLYPLTQLYQIDEDRARGDTTFAVVFGAGASFLFSLSCVALAGVAIVALVFRRFGWADTLLISCVYAALIYAIDRWRRQFRDRVEENFVTLHRLQSVLSIGTLGYMVTRLVLR